MVRTCFLITIFALVCGRSHSSPSGELDTRSSSSPQEHVPAKRYSVNLDLPPEQRWTEIVKDHEEDLVQLLQSVKQSLPSELTSLVSTLGDSIDKQIPDPYGQEIVGIANALSKSNITVSDVVLANILYELTAYSRQQNQNSTTSGTKERQIKMCTSIVAQSLNGSIYHGRNLDYQFSDVFRKVTVVVDFQQGSQTVYTGTTFAGMVGLVTGQKPHSYTISLDQRNSGTWWMNAFEAMVAGTHGITILVIRDSLSNKEMDFVSVVDSLTKQQLVAPSYIIVGGTKPGEGAVITRDRAAARDVWWLDPDNGRWYLVETNYDHWQPPPKDDDRRDAAIKAMDVMTRAGLNATSLFKVLSTPPVLNDDTIYTAVMSAAIPELYNSWVRLDV